MKKLILAGLLGLVAAAPQAVAKELRLASFVPSRAMEHRAILAPWAEAVGEKSSGSLTVKIFAGGSLGKGPVAQFKRAVDGAADITFGIPSFTPSIFPRTTMIEYPLTATSSKDGVEKLYRAMPLLAPEWDKVKLLTLWVSEPLFIITKKKPIKSLADLKGLKIRTPSKWMAETIKSLGGAAIAMPIGGVYNALSQDVIDGVLTGPMGGFAFKLVEVGRYFADGVPFGRLPFFLAMNKKTWNGLSDAHKAVIDDLSGLGLGLKASKAMEVEGEKILNMLRKDPKKQVIAFSETDRAKAIETMKGVRDRLIKDMDAQGQPASKIFAAMEGN